MVPVAAVAACDPLGPQLQCVDPPPVPLPIEPAPEPEPAPRPPTTEEAAVRLLELMNQERAAHGLSAMTRRDDVATVASGHSVAMAAAGDIWHNDEYFSRESHERLQARSLGENVAFNRDVDDAHRRLMASPQHRQNILTAAFTVVGVGVATDAGGRYYITEDFLQPHEPRPAPREAPRSAPATDVMAASVTAPPAPAPAPEVEIAAPSDFELGAWPDATTTAGQQPVRSLPVALVALAATMLAIAAYSTKRCAIG